MLNEQQTKAVEYLNGPLLVLAGPGTGKTQLLSEKVAYILQNTDTDASNILCLTFTDTGAVNMRERLKSVIGPREALKVNIATYHAFGTEILAQYKEYDENYDRRLDSSIDEVEQYKIVKSLQGSLEPMDILRGDQVRDIIATISDAKKARLTPSDLRKIAEQNMADSKLISEMASPLLKNVVKGKYEASLATAYGPIHEILQDFADDEPVVGGIERWGAMLERSLQEALDTAATENSVKYLTKWRDDYFEKDENENWRLKDRIANKKLVSVANIMEEYEKYLEENALFDYDDMIEEAVQALMVNDGFRATLAERYQYIMLDEFQDTNPSQFSIVKALTSYDNPMIMAVGDDDQAIYEFQGALSTNLKDFQEYYNAKVIPLVENYRSTQEILDFATKVIAKAPDKKFDTKQLIAHKPVLPKTGIERLEFESSDAEYGYVASKINELVASGVKQSEIAVITRKSKYFEPLLPYLKEYEAVKIAYAKRDNLFEDEKIHELLTILRLVYEIANEKRASVSMVEVMSYKCFAVPMTEVVKLSNLARQEHSPLFDYMAENGGAEIRAAIEFINTLVAESFTEPLNNLLVLTAGQMDTAGMTEYERFCFYENIASLKGKLKSHYGEKILRLNDLIELVDDYLAAEMAMNTTSPYRDADEAVQLLTVHAAKGLEFEYVFIVSVDNKAWGKAKGNNNLLVLPKNLTQIRHTGATDSERLRVMYVALTRAKEHLIMTNAKRDFTGTAPARLDYFEEHDAKNSVGQDYVAAPLIPSGMVAQVAMSGDLTLRESNIKNWIISKFVQNPDMKPILKEKMRNYRLSATGLTDFVDIIYGGPQSFYNDKVLGIRMDEDSEELAFGNLMHATLEEVTKTGLDDDAAIEYYLSSLEEYNTSQENKVVLRERGPRALAKTLAQFGEIIRTGEAEVKFRSDNIIVSGVPLDGKIDHMVIDEAAKTIEVYDYKTGKFHDERWSSHTTLFKYALQLEFYKMLLNHSRKYRDYKVLRGHILFVSPDDDGEVHAKTYEYGEMVEMYLRNKVDLAFIFTDLVKAVYEQITSMDYVDDAELFIEPSKEYGMSGEREFIKLVLAKSTAK